MGKRKQPQPMTSVMVFGPRINPQETANLNSVIDTDLAAEASFEASRVSRILAAQALSLTNLQPEAMPRLMRL